MSNRTDKVLSISAIVIAIASIVISTWQGIENRNHNRLTVMPKLGISLTVNENLFRISVKNNGLGPAILKKRTLMFEGKEIEWYDHNHLKKIVENFKINGNLSFSLMDEFSTIPVGDEKTLFQFASDSLNENIGFNKMPYLLGFKLDYESMYGEELTCKSDGYDKMSK